MIEDNRKSAEEEKKILIITILTMLILSLLIITSVLLNENNDGKHLNSALYFIKLFNVIISVVGVISCLMVYKRSKNNDIFIITLMYIGLSIGIIFGQIDYMSFYNEKLTLPKYVVISSSLFRILLLIIAVSPLQKIKNKIVSNKYISILTVIIVTLVLGTMEGKLVANTSLNNQNVEYIFISYNIFLAIVYSTVSIILFVESIEKNEYILVVLSSSILIFAFKACYAIYLLNNLTFYTKLISVALTYIAFFIIIIGAIIELLIYMKKIDTLNDDLKVFHTLTENNDYALVVIFNKKGNLLYANKAAKDYYNCNNDLNKLSEILNNKSGKYVRYEEIVDSVKRNNSWRGILKNNDSPEIFDCFVQVIQGENKERYISTTYIDITETLNREIEFEKLKIYDKEKTEFISNISHELKTPLNIFYSSVQLLDTLNEREDIEFREEYKKYSGKLNNNCQRMNRLINNIMDLAKLDLEAMKISFKNYNIITLVEDITLSISELAILKRINIIFDTNEEEQIINCDAELIERMMLNLLSNAIKFSNENSDVFVNIAVKDTTTEIIVKDQGIGMSKENLDIIFKKFVQVDKSFTRQNEGCGIGLSIVKSIADIHDAKILVESELNKGTTFKIIFNNMSVEGCNIENYNVNKAKAKLELSDIYELY